MEKLGAERGRIVAALGPMIRQPNYEVGDELVERFAQRRRGNARFFAAGQRGPCDVRSARLYRRAACRAPASPLEDLGLCTYADPRFFSFRRATHRAEPDYGRHVNAIALSD